MPPFDWSVLGLARYEVLSVENGPTVVIEARYAGAIACPHCRSPEVGVKDRFLRKVRHLHLGPRPCTLHLHARKFRCRFCDRVFNERFPGLLPWRQHTEVYRRQIVQAHRDGISQKTLSDQEGLGHATIERWYQEALARKAMERIDAFCPPEMGIDEHFFSRKEGYATTLCNLTRHRIFDVVLGRSQEALEEYFRGLPGKSQVRLVSMDLSETYRALVRKHVPRAWIVADRFHVIRLVNKAFLATWALLHPRARATRALLRLVRHHEENLTPEEHEKLQTYLAGQAAFKAVYDFKQRLTKLLRIKHRTAPATRRLIPVLLGFIDQLKTSPFEPLAQLGRTMHDWKEEIARMWRFTKNNGMTEGFHTKMEMIQRRAYGFRNFQNYRLRVKVLCG